MIQLKVNKVTFKDPEYVDKSLSKGQGTTNPTSPQDVELVKQAGGAPVEDDGWAAVVPGGCANT